jgi:hypothetical protein
VEAKQTTPGKKRHDDTVPADANYRLSNYCKPASSACLLSLSLMHEDVTRVCPDIESLQLEVALKKKTQFVKLHTMTRYRNAHIESSLPEKKSSLEERNRLIAVNASCSPALKIPAKASTQPPLQAASESTQATDTKPSVRLMQVSLHQLTGAVPKQGEQQARQAARLPLYY